MQDVVHFFERWGTVASCTLFVQNQDDRSPLQQPVPLRLGRLVKHAGKGTVLFEDYQSVRTLINGLPMGDPGSWKLTAPPSIAHTPRGETTPTLW